jgi:hypothetical protein
MAAVGYLLTIQGCDEEDRPEDAGDSIEQIEVGLDHRRSMTSSGNMRNGSEAALLLAAGMGRNLTFR